MFRTNEHSDRETTLLHNCFGRWALGLMLVAGLLLNVSAQVKQVGSPIIRNYERNEFGAGLQTWMIGQDDDGIIYFANNDGLLRFDGTNWNIFPVPNKSIIRSLLVSGNGRIYVGCYDDFGFFEKDESGRLVFHSLIENLDPEVRDFGEVWRIHETNEGLLFQSFTQLMVFRDDELKIYPAPSRFQFSYYINDKILVDDEEEGLLLFKQGRFSQLAGLEMLKGVQIWGVIPDGTNLLLATADKGVYIYDGRKVTPWRTEVNDLLIENQYYCGIRLNSGHIAFGTIQNGLIVCNNQGIPVKWSTRENGLQNNTILCMYQDEQNNLWLGTDIGIDYLMISSPLSLLSYDSGLSAGYTSVLHKGVLYLGTNQGVLYQEWDKFLVGRSQFRLIGATAGQVWTLQVIDDQLFCGHHNGVYIIRNTQARKISDVQGAWTFAMLPDHPGRIIAGTYTGLITLEKTRSGWGYGGRVEGFNESCRTIVPTRDNTLWVSHGLKGVFRIVLSGDLAKADEYSFYGTGKGFETNFELFCGLVGDRLVVSSPNGFYTYDKDGDRFVSDSHFNEIFSQQSITCFLEDARGDLWSFSGNAMEVRRIQEDGSYMLITSPFRQVSGLLGGGFQNVYPLNDHHVFIGFEKGFYHYDPSFPKEYDQPFNVTIARVEAGSDDSVITSFITTTGEPPLRTLPFRYNDLHIYFSSTDYENPATIEYATFLEGHDNSWTTWTFTNDREFTRLREGEYQFHVKARNIFGQVTQPVTIVIEIEPPWGRSTAAYILYFLLSLVFIYITVIIIRRRVRFLKRRERIRQERQFHERQLELEREALESEKKLVNLKNEKLQEEMLRKDKELADTTMQMIQQSKLLSSLKQDLNKLRHDSSSDNFTTDLKKIGRRIDREINNRDQWKIFERHFENVHEEFLNKLKVGYPGLSPNEIRLCAFLRMNISSKEIAALMNISVRGVEISRYRLRKKFGLSRDQNLVNFILSL